MKKAKKKNAGREDSEKKKNEEAVKENEESEKNVKVKEERQVLWVLGVIVMVFVIFFGTYFYVQSMNKFEYAGVSWVIENHGGMKFYHARFLAFGNPYLTYNVYLRNDPRTNNVDTEGDFTRFTDDSFLSFSPEVDECRGVVPVSVVTLASFLSTGVGIENLEPSTTDPQVHYSTGKNFANCNSLGGGVVIEMGESSVTQSEKNPFCYIIRIEDCEDIKPIEKFVIETLRAFKE